MRTLAMLVLTAGLALAQLDSDTITIVARSPAATVPPGSISVSLSVRAAVGTGLEDVLAVVSDLGITERDLAGVDSADGCVGLLAACSPAFTWRFQFTAPLAGLKDTVAKLGRVGAGRSGMEVAYSVASAGTTPTPECAYPTLVSQARRYAENVATAAGVRVGRVVALAEATAGGVVVPTAVVRNGDFSGLLIPATFTGILSSAWFAPPPPVILTYCGVTVQFQIVH